MSKPIYPPHAPTSDRKVADLRADMERHGWRGRPLLVIDCGDHYLATNGSHRIAAAGLAGIMPELHVIECGTDDGQDAERSQRWAALIDAMDDDDRLAALVALRDAGEVDDTAVLLMREEIGQP